MNSFSNGFWPGLTMGFAGGMFGALTGSYMGLGNLGYNSSMSPFMDMNYCLTTSDQDFTRNVASYNLCNRMETSGLDFGCLGGFGLGGFGLGGFGLGGFLC